MRIENCNECFFCHKPLLKFMITPILETSEGVFNEVCEECADEKFPGWENED